jgi:hypothetical protein
MNTSNSAEIYDHYYYAHGCGLPYGRTEHYLRFFNRAAEGICTGIQPTTVLDAGCAMGMLVECLRNRKVQAWGIDLSEYAIQNAHPDVRPFLWVGSICEPFPQKYDLIVAIEIFEHLTPEQAEQAAEVFCQHAPDILFSSTPYDYVEATHLNVQPPEYWAELFARHGFIRDVDFDAGFITPWAVRFRRNQEPLPRVVRGYERKFWFLWKENQDLRQLNLDMRNQLSVTDQKIRSLEAELADVRNGAAWKLVLGLRSLRLKLVPPGSRREKLFRRLFAGSQVHRT